MLMSLDFEKYGMMGVIISVHDVYVVSYVFTYPKFKADLMPAFFGVVYVAVMLLYLSYQEPSRWKISGMADLYAPGDAIPAHIVWEC